jgi:hypothetical protein
LIRLGLLRLLGLSWLRRIRRVRLVTILSLVGPVIPAPSRWSNRTEPRLPVPVVWRGLRLGLLMLVSPVVLVVGLRLLVRRPVLLRLLVLR